MSPLRQFTAQDVIVLRGLRKERLVRQRHTPKREVKGLLAELGVEGRQRRMFLKWVRRQGREHYCDTSATNALDILASAVDKWRTERGFILV